DSHAKVQMRKKVRGLRGIERSVLKQRRQRIKEEAQALPQSSIVIETVNAERPCCRGRTGRRRDPGVLHRGSGHPQRRSGWAASSARFADGGGFGRGSGLDPTKPRREKRGFP